MVVSFLSGLAALSRPCYLTTDESGIGVTTSRTNRALLWAEVHALQVYGATWYLTLDTSERLRLDMVGYSTAARDSLLQLLTNKAALQQSDHNTWLSDRAARSLPTDQRMLGPGNLPARPLMDPTKISPGDRNLPVPSADAAPAAYQRAPTLMAGVGSHGEVRVWAPEIAAIRWRVVAAGASLAGLLTLMVSLNLPSHWACWLGACMGTAITTFVSGLASGMRPCHITTNQSGMEVTTRNASRTFLWSEIQSLQTGDVRGGEKWVVTLGSSEKLRLNMSGYSSHARKCLRQLLTQETGLQQDPRKKRLYERIQLALPTSERAE